MKFFEKYKTITVLLGVGFLLRILLSSFGTLHLDQGTFISWSNALLNEGFKNFYNSWSDYLPGYPYILWLLAKINTYQIIPETVLYKIPAILADLFTGLIIYKILLKSKGQKWGLIGAGLYIFNPAIWGNSALWGQVDSLTALFSMLTLYLLPANYILSAISLAVGTLIKPQAAFIFPVVIYMMFVNKQKISQMVIFCLTGLFIYVLAFVPFWNRLNLIQFILERMSLSLNQYPYTSVNAFNFWGIIGFWKPDNIYTSISGYLLVILASAFLAFKLRRTKQAEYYLAAFIFAASFGFFTRMHERHLLPVFAPLIVVAIENPMLMIPYIGFSLTYSANLYYAFYWVSDNFREVFGGLAVKFISFLNVVFAGFIFYTVARNLSSSWKRADSMLKRFITAKGADKTIHKLPKIPLTQKKAGIILTLILVFAFVTRVFDLNSPSEMYFDEVYHAFTAKVILSPDVAKAWEWWNTPPDGFAYEWTHPPLAKLGMALGMLTFGQNSFGWRIPGALIGAGAVYLIYLLARQIFKDEVVGLLSAAVFGLDGLALVMSRIGMNDSYILFFSLLSLYLYLKDKNFLSALSFGLAIASKWSAIWAIPIFGVMFLSYRKKINISYLWFFILPVVVYLASYFDMFLTGHDLGTWWGMQQQMWWYHTQLEATHPYTSQWWSWPFLLRPIYLYTSEELGGMVARIYAFGNPLVFWFGAASVATALVYSYLEKNKRLALIVFSYLIFFVPWALSPRIMFLYHYLPSIPFLAIATGYILRRSPKLIPYFFIPALLTFIYFYPHWAGLQIPLWLDQSYYWVSSWR
jgi:predicted membrane-bound dolichyl-phosphate-mannose-protein mannosyltransferase